MFSSSCTNASDYPTTKMPLKNSEISTGNIADLYFQYDIQKSIDLILSKNYKNIALQFPDDLLHDSTTVAQEIMLKSNSKCYVLADTTYGSCCVDEIAAEHAHADFIIHYGRACLSPTIRFPVQYVFPKNPCDLNFLIDKLSILNNGKNILIMWDVYYHYMMDSLKAECTLRNFSFVFSELLEPESCVVSKSSLDRDARKFNLPKGHDISNYDIVYIGQESSTLTRIIMTNHKSDVYLLNPKTNDISIQNESVNKLLARRYFLIQKAKDAEVIGIVVGTLGVRRAVLDLISKMEYKSYLDVIDLLQKCIIKSGKKPYVFAMGKPSPAKLGNFLEVQTFVLVACPENSLLDSREFMVPLITPFELLLAIGSLEEWGGYYELNLMSITNKLINQLECDSNHSDNEEEPYFSLVSGGYKQKCKGTVELESKKPEILDGKLVSMGEMKVSHYNPVGDHFNARIFKGLEVKKGETLVVKVEKGREGIASGYTHEI